MESSPYITKIASVEYHGNGSLEDFQSIISLVLSSESLTKAVNGTLGCNDKAIKNGCLTSTDSVVASTSEEKDLTLDEDHLPARQVPFDGLRKERHWFYFYTHEQWKPVYRKLVKLNEDDSCDPYNSMIKGRGMERWMSVAPLLTCKKSRIHRVGVFAGQPIRKNGFIAEYCGELIRNSLVERRETFYRRRNFGSYMFRLDESFTIDSTLRGCMARFINHSCDANCYAKVITHGGEKKIVLIAKRQIASGEEIFYDYKLPEEREKIPCLCGTPYCRKYLN